MSEKIVQMNKEVIKGQIKELVGGRVEETLNELLEQEAEKSRPSHKLCKPPRRCKIEAPERRFRYG